MSLLVNSLKGIQGEVTVPSIGLTVGTMQSWELRRREDLPAGETAVWIFRAAFSYLNTFAYSEKTLKKKITIKLGNKKVGKQYEIIPSPTAPVTMSGKALVIVGVEACLVE